VGASDGDLKGLATLPSSFGLYCHPVAPHPRGLLAFKGLPPALFVLLSPVLHHSHHGVGDAAPPPPRGRIVYVSESRSATACLNDSLVVRIIVGYEYKIFRSSFFFSLSPISCLNTASQTIDCPARCHFATRTKHLKSWSPTVRK
jgi:hypothetical protein